MEKQKENGYTFHTLKLKPDYEGEVVATLIEKKTEKPSKKAMLYLHGFNDYFFQDHFADWANKLGFNFYALELRKYGRSILPIRSPIISGISANILKRSTSPSNLSKRKKKMRNLYLSATPREG